MGNCQYKIHLFNSYFMMVNEQMNGYWYFIYDLHGRRWTFSIKFKNKSTQQQHTKTQTFYITPFAVSWVFVLEYMEIASQLRTVTLFDKKIQLCHFCFVTKMWQKDKTNENVFLLLHLQLCHYPARKVKRTVFQLATSISALKIDFVKGLAKTDAMTKM